MSSKAEKHILSSDYAAVKESPGGEMTINMPNSITIGSGQVWQASATLSTGVAKSSERVLIRPGGSTNFMVGHTIRLEFAYTTQIAGNTVYGDIRATTWRSANGTVTARLSIFNPHDVPLNKTGGFTGNWTFRVRSFLPPFPA